MMKTNTIFLIPVFLLFVLFGCATPQHPASASKVTQPPAGSEKMSSDPAPAPAKPETEVKDEDIEATDEDDSAEIAESRDRSEQNEDAADETDQDTDQDAESGSGLALKTEPVFEEAMESCEKAQELWKAGDSEKALESLDHAYSLILEADTQDDPELGRQKEDLRFMISKRILEIYASRNIVAKGNHKAIQMTMNHHVEAEIALLTKPAANGEEPFFLKAYRRAGKYQAKMAAEFEKAGLPVELSWLPLIESGFRTETLSPARALGLWQFIPSTGYKFGLKRDRYVDERMDPEKSTRAAIEYLKELHRMFGDWSTVLAAYNCGEGRVLQVIRQQNINYLDNFWDLYEKLPRETARYVPRFLATIHIINNPEKYGLNKTQPMSPPEYETVGMPKMVSISDVAQSIGTDKDTLASLNPELRHHVVPGSYSLKVPKNTSQNLLASLDRIPVSSPPKPEQEGKYQYHKVRQGESLAKIAKQYRVSARKLARANSLGKRGRAVAGDILKIPTTKAYTASGSGHDDDSGVTRYVVRKGESLADIAKRYGTTAKEIRAFNHLSKKKVTVAQVLKIPGNKKSSEKSGSDRRVYRVKNGDSVKDIAKQHNMPLKRFLKVNNLTQRSKLYPGQTLTVE